MTTTKRKPGQCAGIDYAGLTPAQLALPRAELAEALGITRNALWAGLNRACRATATIGRPVKAIPEDVTAATLAGAIMERHGVCMSTARKWIARRRWEGAGS